MHLEEIQGACSQHKKDLNLSGGWLICAEKILAKLVKDELGGKN